LNLKAKQPARDTDNLGFGDRQLLTRERKGKAVPIGYRISGVSDLVEWKRSFDKDPLSIRRAVQYGFSRIWKLKVTRHYGKEFQNIWKKLQPKNEPGFGFSTDMG
jgi:hypothetical protein